MVPTDPTVMRVKLGQQPDPASNEFDLLRPWDIPKGANPEIRLAPDQKELFYQGKPAVGQMIVNVIVEPADPPTDR